jgi:hypothetical protein
VAIKFDGYMNVLFVSDLGGARDFYRNAAAKVLTAVAVVK